ncbi:MAG: argininosuccinate lyase [Anaerolineae bacterium]|nr:argininosuccinate lyase [Anaerolineae bacterium]
MTLWGGRFDEPTDADLRALNDSLGFDRRMWREDIAGSRAYAAAIAAAGVFSGADLETILDGLTRIEAEFEQGHFQFAPGDEDIHTAVERRLIELVGAVGGRLHTGRSRNDQVATDFRLWVMQALRQVDALLHGLQAALVVAATPHTATLMPGYTHMQPAQPVTVAHWLLSYFWMLRRDRERLHDAHRRTAISPLGSGALAGTPFPVDRAALAQALHFAGSSENSLDAVSDRDFAAEFLFVLALLGTHLSRLAEDVILFSNPAFGFITLDDRYSTGSSLMPQKRNPDPMELARGKAGRLIGHLTGLLTTLKGLPTGYNKDLQEDKEPVFDAFDTVQRLLPVLTAVVRTLKLNPDRLQAALVDEMLATDLADYLVKKGLPFREAHHVVGSAVRLAQTEQIAFRRLPPARLRALSPLFADDVAQVFDFAASVDQRRAPGGTAPAAVRQQLAQAEAYLQTSAPIR